VVTTVFLTPTVAADFGTNNFAGHAFELALLQNGQFQDNVTFPAPILVNLHYSQDDVSRGVEAGLALWQWTGSDWQKASDRCNPPRQQQLNDLDNILVAPICQTGRYALFVPAGQIYLPVISRSN
jgi:hypothetical protein